jgi:hypothetical protein
MLHHEKRRGSFFGRRRTTCAAALLVATLFAQPHTALAAWARNGNPVCRASGMQDESAIDWAHAKSNAGKTFEGAVIAWRDSRPGADGSDIYAQFIDTDGLLNWPSSSNPQENGVVICDAAGSQREPKVAVASRITDENNVWFGWLLEEDNGLHIFANSRLASEGLNQTDNGVRVCTDNHEQRDYDMVGDYSTGDVIVVWADNRNGNWDIYAQRLKSVPDNGIQRAWGDNGVVVCKEDSVQDKPRVVLADYRKVGGAFVVVWEDERAGRKNRDIYAQRLNVDGDRVWALAGKPVCNDTGAQKNFDVIAADRYGDRGVIVAWEDYRAAQTDSTRIDIYAQKLDKSGDVAWPSADGVVVTAATKAQLSPRLVADDKEGAFVVWVDQRAARPVFYHQRLDQSGAVKLDQNGVKGKDADEPYPWGFSLSGVRGGFVVSRVVGSAPDLDIDATRYNIYGREAQSAPLSRAFLNQYRPVAPLLGAPEAAIVAFTDTRNDDFDVYASIFKVPPVKTELQPQDSSPVTADTPRPLRLTLLPNRPNPFGTSTELNIGAQHDADGTIRVFDVAGREVCGPRPIRVTAGWQRVQFDARDNAGRPLPSGVYFCRVESGNQVARIKMVVSH